MINKILAGIVNIDQTISPIFLPLEILPKEMVPENIIMNRGANDSKDQTCS
jgi:hypothetical protein